MCVVYQAVENGIGDRRLADRAMPEIHRNLTCHERGAVSATASSLHRCS